VVAPAQEASLCPLQVAQVAQDQELVEHCLAGSRWAWNTLFEENHPLLLHSIAAMLGPLRGQNLELVDEIAARVWFAVVSDRAELLGRFEQARGCRLATYLAAIAKDQMIRLFRSEKRRAKRETKSLEGKPSSANDDHSPISLQEFKKALTPAEREFFEEVLIGGNGTETAEDYSDSNRWQLTSRIRNKLRDQLRDN
jgi:DNA-directed RNA polymerase specialized sigma24 family protein